MKTGEVEESNCPRDRQKETLWWVCRIMDYLGTTWGFVMDPANIRK